MNKFKEIAKYTAVSIGIGLLATLLLLLIMSALIIVLNISFSLYPIFAVSCLVVGAVICGFCNARLNENNGLIFGLLSSAVMYFIILIVTVILGFNSIGTQLFIKFIIVLLSGAIGGIIGVNNKKSKQKI